MITIDSLNLKRLDFMKIDVEGMEVEALKGAKETLARCLPQLVIEKIKVEEHLLIKLLNPLGYLFFGFGINSVAVHKKDPSVRILPQA